MTLWFVVSVAVMLSACLLLGATLFGQSKDMVELRSYLRTEKLKVHQLEIARFEASKAYKIMLRALGGDKGAVIIKMMQEQHLSWRRRNFPNSDKSQAFAGIVEEVGELSHALLKRAQGIRINEDHNAAVKDALGDIFIFMLDFSNHEGVCLNDCIANAWDEVSKRDWVKNKIDGKS